MGEQSQWMVSMRIAEGDKLTIEVTDVIYTPGHGRFHSFAMADRASPATRC
jgi:hypothetical protein